MLEKVREVAGLSYDEAAARLGVDARWLIRVETGFAAPRPEEAARILAGYGAREATVADEIIDLARRASAPPPWLEAHASRLSAAGRDAVLLEAEATLAQLHGFRVIPYLVQTEGYFRDIEAGNLHECDADQEWDLLSHRQAHRPSGVTRLLDVIIDESAFELKISPGAMAGQLRRLLELADSPHATIRIIPKDAALWEERVHNFDVLSFAGTADRIAVFYYLSRARRRARLCRRLRRLAGIKDTAAASPADSRMILSRHLTALS
jgi:transcriptional regulator with XRE-family HTH domain